MFFLILQTFIPSFPTIWAFLCIALGWIFGKRRPAITCKRYAISCVLQLILVTTLVISIFKNAPSADALGYVQGIMLISHFVFARTTTRRIKGTNLPSYAVFSSLIPFIGFSLAVYILVYSPSDARLNRRSMLSISLVTLVAIIILAWSIHHGSISIQYPIKTLTPANTKTVHQINVIASPTDRWIGVYDYNPVAVSSIPGASNFIIDGRSNNVYNVLGEIRSGACSGDFEGTGILQTANHMIAHMKNDETCQLTLDRSSNSEDLKVTEENGCRGYHGIGCSYDGSYTRK